MERENEKIKARELLAYIKQWDDSVELSGKDDTEISGFSSLNSYIHGSITWIKNQDNVNLCSDKLTAVVCSPGIEAEAEVRIITENPKDIFYGDRLSG